MRVLGWLGTILCAPFYCFFMLMDKLKVLYWIPIGTGVYGVYLVFVGVQSIIQDSMGSGAVIFILHAVIVGSFFACWVFLGVLVWHLLFIANNLIYMLVNLLLIPFAYGFTYCNAWRQGMSKCELEGKLAYIQHEKDLRKQEIKARRDAKKEEKERKKQEQYAKGYQKQQEKRTGSYQDTSWSDNHGYKEYYTGQRNQSGNYQTANDSYMSALSLFMLEEGYTLDELKKQRNRLMKSFHPDEDDTETVRYAQKINWAYEVLKNRVCA